MKNMLQKLLPLCVTVLLIAAVVVPGLAQNGTEDGVKIGVYCIGEEKERVK